MNYQNDEVEEICRVDSVDVPLQLVSGELRRRYSRAMQDVQSCKPGPQRNVLKAALTAVAKEVLVEAMPLIALKASPRFSGAAGFFTALTTRTS